MDIPHRLYSVTRLHTIIVIYSLGLLQINVIGTVNCIPWLLAFGTTCDIQ